jgi:DNA-binding NarL/FixJ family response regulator
MSPVVATAVSGTVLIAAGAFWLSFTSLANALHAVIAADASVPAVVAAAVASVPPVVLLAITHLTVHLTRTVDTATQPGPGEPPPAPAAPPSKPSAVDQRAEAEQLRLDGMSNRAIARHLGVHPSTVGRWLAPLDSTPESFTAPITKEQQ